MNAKYALKFMSMFLMFTYIRVDIYGQVANFKWFIEDRYIDSWHAWQEAGYSNKPSCVHPEGYELKIDADSSSAGGGTISKYSWQLKEIIERSFIATPGSSSSGISINRSNAGTKIKAGKYFLKLTITTSLGRSKQRTQPFEIKDWLIVSLGDSFSSEGNPEDEGRYRPLA